MLFNKHTNVKNHRKHDGFFTYIYEQIAKFFEKVSNRYDDSAQAKYFDTKEELQRYRDSENTMLRNMEEDAILAADRAGLDINELRVEMIIETTYEPCIICKREMLLREQLLGANTTIEVEFPNFIDKEGVFRGVQGSEELIIFLNQ